MVFDTECMLTDPVSMTERYERQREESRRQRHVHIDKRFDKLEEKETVGAACRVCEAAIHVSEREAMTALDENGGDEAKAIEDLMDYEYLQRIRKKVCEGAKVETGKPISPKDRKLNGRASRKASDKCVPQRECPPLPPLDAVDTTGWSAERLTAYGRVQELPNLYLYSYPAPGKTQRHGAWSPQEHERFMMQSEAFGGWDKLNSPQTQWGIFALGVESRVGYQCSNYYIYLNKRRGERKRRDTA
ncbi:hypothetical protein GUITHDRAFT_141984 [Guillardia theta CCMP2712]|uniref:Myb-like domain-containing protein n=1 Tax=Guillardia theta (strain CCMP2712) TaxID=905079 RepID=L1IZ01_GUITC|nr:hypothetical protein GUITHDRAFT_141984 [Guillardia theta CCMP2712]EKX41503.1 hypothetical protein GUITHDRAFT_141984 [Guillardia theta CCMP2712]|eukprot:XP_005828483.1 hypothetical protein GUITHDRAFT_141984 [Guillardia theta CCMP2712]